MQEHQPLKLRLTGVCDLIMHNGQLADPLNGFAREMKKVSNKRVKTEADMEQLQKLEFLGGLYFNRDGAICVPGDMIEAMLLAAAKKTKQGPSITAGVICAGTFPLEYEGPAAPEELFKDPSFRLTCGVKVARNRIMRTRPKFPKWAVNVDLLYLPDVINRKSLVEIAQTGGRLVGLGDWRPRWGRFEAAEV